VRPKNSPMRYTSGGDDGWWWCWLIGWCHHLSKAQLWLVGRKCLTRCVFFLPRCLQQLEPFMSQDNGQIEETICFQMTRINNWNRKFRCACNNNSTGSTHTHEALRRPQGPLKTKRNFTMIKKTFVYFEVAAVLHLGSTRLSEIICQSDGI